MAATCCGGSWPIMWNRIDRMCGRTARWLGEYIDATLPLLRRRAVEAHLRRCDRCRRELEATRRTVALLADLPRRELSAGFEAGLRARLANTQRRRGRPRYLSAPWPSRFRRLALAGALAAAALALGVWRLQDLPQSPQPAPAYVAALVQEHQVLRAGGDLNSTVVSRH